MIRHKPYINRHKIELSWSKDFGCYLVKDKGWMDFPTDFYLGERWVYTTPGFDTYSANFRGNESDNWSCIDFGKDLLRALDWLHQAKRRWRGTKRLWTKLN